jgi:AraC-like DNA-binding protein
MSKTRSNIWMAPSAKGVERVGAHFLGHAFAPHRHDTYAIGVTTMGLQRFDYRGTSHTSSTGNVFILHPDELHDGRQGDERGFGYRCVYIDPELLREAAEARSAPFLNDPVSADTDLCAAVAQLLANLTDPLSELEVNCGLAAIAEAVARQSQKRLQKTVDVHSLQLVREFLIANTKEKVQIVDLERMSGLSRWQLARQFRSLYGINPYRFHLFRRLEASRLLLRDDTSLADIALQAGFADQAHFSRLFREAFGVSPGRWRKLCT